MEKFYTIYGWNLCAFTSLIKIGFTDKTVVQAKDYNLPNN